MKFFKDILVILWLHLVFIILVVPGMTGILLFNLFENIRIHIDESKAKKRALKKEFQKNPSTQEQ